MSPLFMDTGYEPNSPGSLSAEESHSNTAGSEREGEGQQMGPRGTRKQEKNRDAARKSRRKQTERADELHEELQQLERSNSALQKEIASLKKDLHLYETALDRHEPNCHLRASATSSTPPTVPPQTSTSAASPSLSTSLASSTALQTLKCVKRTRLSPSVSAPTTSASSAGSAELFTASSSSSPVTVPYSVSFSTHPAPQSLFSAEPLITSRPTNVMPACTSLVSNPVLPSAAQLKSGQGTIHETSSMSADAHFTVDAFLTKQASFLPASPNMVPTYSHLEAENTGVVAQGCPMNVPLLHPCQFSRSQTRSSPPFGLLPSLQSPAPQSLSVSLQPSLEPSPAPPFALNPSYNQEITPSPGSLLSRLTVPGPVKVSPTTSSSFDGSQPPLSMPLLEDPSKDLSLSELLEINDWILSGNSNQ